MKTQERQLAYLRAMFHELRLERVSAPYCLIERVLSKIKRKVGSFKI